MNRLFTLTLLLCSVISFGQNRLRVLVIDSSKAPVPSASVSLNNYPVGITDSFGLFVADLAAGKYKLAISSTGFETQSAVVILPDTNIITIRLVSRSDELDAVTVISSTRNNQSIERSPLKVEVLGQEELDEENTIKPGNIASLLGDISGVQIQQSSATSGNANVRIQGLEGRYTQILRDGMPLFEGFSGGFGILTIPPLDLRQIELIKGSASTLYGGGAIAGLINLISKKPNRKLEALATLNASTLGEKNVNVWTSKRNDRFGYTLFTGYTRQSAVDVNDDGFTDLPATDGFAFHPKIFLYPGSHSTISLGYSGVFDKRTGGDMEVLANRGDNEHQYYEKNRSNRNTGELLYEQYFTQGKKLELKGSLSQFDRQIMTNVHKFHGQQVNYFSEASILVPFADNSFVGGINVSGNKFNILPSDPVRLLPYSNRVAGAFLQLTSTIKDATTLEAGIRYDYHNNYGGFFLPRVAIFHRFNEHWGSRAGLGFGYKTPDPLGQQLTDIPIPDIPPIPALQQAERSIGMNAEINYKTSWDEDNSFFINHAFFLTSVRHPVILTENNGTFQTTNGAKPVNSKGFDTYIQLTLDSWELYAGYTYTIAERQYLDNNQFMPLTPRNRMAFTLVKAWEGKWRLGLEGSYTGKQHRLD